MYTTEFFVRRARASPTRLGRGRLDSRPLAGRTPRVGCGRRRRDWCRRSVLRLLEWVEHVSLPEIIDMFYGSYDYLEILGFNLVRSLLNLFLLIFITWAS